jgi:hypothetical protein
LEFGILFEGAAKRFGNHMFAPALREPAVFVQKLTKYGVQPGA